MSKKRLTISQDVCTETLALLITIAWADGSLDESERDGVRAAAQVLNLSREMRARLDQLLQAPLPLDELLFDAVGPRDRAFAFVAAAWMTQVDSSVDPREIAMLDDLARLLEIDATQKEELLLLSEDLAPRGEERSHWAAHVVSLFRSIPLRLHRPLRDDDDDDDEAADAEFYVDFASE